MSAKVDDGPPWFAASLAAATAAVAPPFLIGIFEEQPTMWIGLVFPFIYALILTLGYVWLVAIPLYVFLQKRWHLRWWIAALAGALLGAIPAFLLVASPGPGYSALDGVAQTIDGRYTEAGLRGARVLVFWASCCGIVGALAFWGMLKRATRMIQP